MVLLRFRIEVSAWDRQRALTILQTDLVERSLDVRGNPVRVVAKISPDRRPMSKTHAIWLNVWTKHKLEGIQSASNGRSCEK